MPKAFSLCVHVDPLVSLTRDASLVGRIGSATTPAKSNCEGRKGGSEGEKRRGEE